MLQSVRQRWRANSGPHEFVNSRRFEHAFKKIRFRATGRPFRKLYQFMNTRHGSVAAQHPNFKGCNCLCKIVKCLDFVAHCLLKCVYNGQRVIYRLCGNKRGNEIVNRPRRYICTNRSIKD